MMIEKPTPPEIIERHEYSDMELVAVLFMVFFIGLLALLILELISVINA